MDTRTSELVRPNIVVVGSLNIDIVVEAGRAPAQGETLTGEQVHFIPGGKGANQALAASRLGANVTMIGAVGQDKFGQQLIADLNANGVNTTHIAQLPNVTTGVASIWVTEGDNRIIIVAGANGKLTPAMLKEPTIESCLRDADVVLLQLETEMETVVQAAQISSEGNAIVLLNPAPAPVSGTLPQELLSRATILVPNQSELAALLGLSTLETQDEVTQAMHDLASANQTVVITTLGSEGSAYIDRRKNEVEGVEYAPAHKVEVVDTTGAGDCFCAALGVALGRGEKVGQAVTYASAASALAVTKFGAQAGMPTQEEVVTFMKQ